MTTALLVEPASTHSYGIRRRWLDNLPAGRIVAIDVARFFALIGMVFAHTATPYAPNGDYLWWGELTTGRPSVLFATLAGVSLALMTGGTKPLKDATSRYVGLAVRAVLVFVIGLALAMANTGILIILPVYATLFLLLIPFLRWRARTLFALGGAWLVIGPVLFFLANRAQLGFIQTADVAAGSNLTVQSVWDYPVSAVYSIFLTGTYPALVWFGYMLIGAGVGRCDLRSWRPAAWLTGVGAAMTGLSLYCARFAQAAYDTALDQGDKVAGSLMKYDAQGAIPKDKLKEASEQISQSMYGDWRTLLGIHPHSGTIGEAVGSIGSALLVIGLCLLVVRTGFRLWSVLFGAGAMTLTLYAVHIVFTTYGPTIEHPLRYNLLLLVPVGMVFGLLGRSGPLEKIVAWTSARVIRPAVRG